MRRSRSRGWTCALALLLALLCMGCGLEGGVDKLFSLPELSDEYLELQRVIDGVRATGAVYCAPEAGSHRQSVQLYDINGDGTQEALVFFSVAGERPLKIYVFIKNEQGYETAAVIEGDGDGIESIDYVDMDGDGWTEAVVGWGMGPDLKMLSIYALKGFQVSAIATADYAQYTAADMDGDGRTELLVYHRAAETENYGSVELFSLNADGETESTLTRISAGMDTVSRFSVSALKDLPAALYVEGTCAGGMVTDILTYTDGVLRNITLSETSGVSDGTLRTSAVGFRDLNGDGVVEIPIPRTLPAQGETVYRVLDWYGYNSRGKRTIVMTTYHNYSDSWYLILPDEWGDAISIRREDSDAGERGVVFSLWNGQGEPVSDFLTIYAISGENREVLAVKDDRFVLYRGVEVLYAAKLHMSRSQWSLAPDITELRSRFKLIYSEWISGIQ